MKNIPYFYDVFPLLPLLLLQSNESIQHGTQNYVYFDKYSFLSWEDAPVKMANKTDRIKGMNFIFLMLIEL